MKWDRLAQTKGVGSLGFRSFKVFNTTILVKQWWQMMAIEGSLMSRVYKEVYFRRSSIHSTTLGYRPNYVLRSMYEAKWVIDRVCYWRVGSGSNICVWDDPRVPSTTNFKHMYGQNWCGTVHTVSDLLDKSRGCWREELVRQVFVSHEAKMVFQLPITRTSSYIHSWTTTADEVLTKKFVYHFILRQMEIGCPSPYVDHDWDALWRRVRRVKSVPRCRYMAWRVCHGFLPTRKN